MFVERYRWQLKTIIETVKGKRLEVGGEIMAEIV
jgi:hypothetical protein